MSEVERHIGLFGGSFNPPHVCHTLATHWVLQTHPVDEVWWVPTYQHAFSKRLVEFEHRRTMCEMALKDLDRVRISAIEKQLGGESRTIDTVRALQEQFSDHRFSLIVGTDILEETHRWKDWDGLMELVDLIVIGRSGHTQDDDPESAEFRLPDISSTDTRKALEQGEYEKLEFWLASDVIAYVAEYGLYLD
ncbi:MAG: nicotinate (nicotinamide) nucleotide adenylyltransferase [Myxococcota bacterium]